MVGPCLPDRGVGQLVREAHPPARAVHFTGAKQEKPEYHHHGRAGQVAIHRRGWDGSEAEMFKEHAPEPEPVRKEKRTLNGEGVDGDPQQGNDEIALTSDGGTLRVVSHGCVSGVRRRVRALQARR